MSLIPYPMHIHYKFSSFLARGKGSNCKIRFFFEDDNLFWALRKTDITAFS